ncbi:hypothetical protein HBI22_233090 [Parastagonospora nodorum]|nr:hypothetical protein HBI28_215740 [Parastagonospora nodorum]KAH5618586.1 hypothetical protein HBI22_233090 [Parastagonospora nodorum]
MCAKDDLIRRKSPLQLAGELAIAESVTIKEYNILSLIAFIISYYLFADKLRSTPSTLLARFIPITKIRNPLLKTLENAAKSGILLACADGRIRQCYLTICAILANYEEQVLLTSIKKNRYCTRYTTSIEQKAIIQQLIAVVSPLFILKAPFALHFIRAVCDLHALTYIIQDIRIYRALDSICTRANSEAYYITIVKQFYSMINKKEYILQIYRKHIAYIRAFSKVLLFNNNRQINNTTRMLSVPFKFYDLSTIIRLVHLVLRDLPNSTTRTTMSYYVNNYID